MGQKIIEEFFVEHDGETFRMSPYDFNAIDEIEIHRATGVMLTSIFTGRGTTLGAVAALVWRTRVNRGESDLTFMDVARTFTYKSLETISDEAPEGGGTPEAQGGS